MSTHSPLNARLPLYLRALRQLLAQGEGRVCSAALSQMTGVGTSLVRSDLRRFPGCGISGYGYQCKPLYHAIAEHLGLGDAFSAVIVGEGGVALSRLPVFAKRGIRLKAIFVQGPDVQASPLCRDVCTLADFLAHERVDLILFAAPLLSGEALLSLATEGGVRGIWNLTEQDLPACEGIEIENYHPLDALFTFCAALRQKQNEKEDDQ